MEDGDDERRTRSPDPNDGRITVTLASSAAAALPKSCAAREDCWSEAATSTLIDAWGERYLALNRGNLKQVHWKEVADIANSSREMHGRTPKTDMQCKNRIDTVKKKYKLEKSKMASSSSPSRWSFFHKLDHLIGPATKTPTPLAVVRHPKTHSSETERPNSPDSTDTYPPKPGKKRRSTNNPNSTANSYPKGKKKHDGRGRFKKLGVSSSSMGELAKAILNLGEAYEQAENAKVRQVMEMEKHRMKFTKDLELQRMQLFMKTQLEISQTKEAVMNSYRNNHLRHQLYRNDNKHVNNNNNISNQNSD